MVSYRRRRVVGMDAPCRYFRCLHTCRLLELRVSTMVIFRCKIRSPPRAAHARLLVRSGYLSISTYKSTSSADSLPDRIVTTLESARPPARPSVRPIARLLLTCTFSLHAYRSKMHATNAAGRERGFYTHYLHAYLDSTYMLTWSCALIGANRHETAETFRLETDSACGTRRCGMRDRTRWETGEHVGVVGDGVGAYLL